MKKRLFALTLAFFLLSLSACGSSAGNSASDMPAPMVTEAESMSEAGYTTGNGVSNKDIADTTSTAAESQDKIIYSADAEIETKEYEKSVDGVYQLIEDYDGFLQSSSVGGTSYDSVGARYADFTIRIPSDRFTELTNSLSTLGNVASCRTDAQNVTSQYVDIEARLDSYKIQEERLLAMLEKAEKLEDMLQIESQLTEVRYNIEQYTTQLNNLENQVSYSTVSLRIEEVVEYSPDNSVTQSFFSRMKTALTAGISGLVSALQGIVLFILYFWYVIAAGVVAAVLIIRRRRKKCQNPGEK
ncbi:MAG: DUF4349 domain-containing protein [Oscillospiraceae bacterium]